MPMSAAEYVHGYEARESERLVDQANVLARLLHSDTTYPAGAQVLEAGCGVGEGKIEYIGFGEFDIRYAPRHDKVSGSRQRFL